MSKTYTLKKKTNKAFGTAFLGKKAYKEVKMKLPDGYKPPSDGYKKPFNYKLWNTLKKKGRVE